MADAFADLWNSVAPTKPAPAPQKLGSIAVQPPQARRPQQDVFSLLASAGSSASTSRSITPSRPGVIQPQRSGSSSNGSARAGTGDAFSDLLTGSRGSSSSGAKLTMAERAAQAERERLAQVHQSNNVVKVRDSTWEGLDNLESTKPAATATSDATLLDDEWAFSFPAASHNTTNTPSIKVETKSSDDDDWGLGDFSNTKPSIAQPSAAPAKQAIWDLDDFSQSQSPPTIQEPVPRSDSPGDFDFGNRENALLDDDDSNDEGDLLGMLGKPADAIPKRSHPSKTPFSHTPKRSSETSQPASPPPHIVGQIVEMGFSPQQARQALAKTGNNVQASLELLLQNGEGSSSRPRSRTGEVDTEPSRGPVRKASNPAGTGTRERLAGDTPPPAASNTQLQEQADKLLAQASEIGLNVFSRANAFWNSGKEKALKAYEEHTKQATASTSSRPKWMQDTREDGDGQGWHEGESGFSDEVVPPKSTSSRPSAPKSSNTAPSEVQSQPKVADLFSDEPIAYVSPFRRGRPKPTEAPAPTSLPRRAPSPIPLVVRRTISASPSAIASSAKHKALGGEKFKLGQYGEAESCFTAAISALPTSHLLLVPLYNNRALTRLKTGDHTSAVDDATTVLSMIGTDYKPNREAKVTRDDEGAGVDLADGLVKAWRRRAEAYEGKEKWEDARKDWESIAAAEWAGSKMRDEAVRGAGRCRRMVAAPHAESSSKNTTRPPVKPKPTATRPPVRRGPTPPSQALSNLRQANMAAEAEEQARYELKDSVDTRLIAWKGGKETNIRALLASLDSVLWPELGWQKVGMAEVVTPSQVKIRYTKAIAKLHPDKLNVHNTTLEQRMVANGVFGALNEAWNGFNE